MVTDDVVTFEPEAFEVPELDSRHRCCRCGAQAYVVSKKTDWENEFYWCKHHYETNEIALGAAGFTTVRDERDKLVKRSNEVHA